MLPIIQDNQALLKAKYFQRVGAASRTPEKHPKTHVTLTFDLQILWVSGDCEDTCSYKISLRKVQRFMSYPQWPRFWTTVDFDRVYLRMGSSNRQAENGVMNYDVFHVWWKQFGELWST